MHLISCDLRFAFLFIAGGMIAVQIPTQDAGNNSNVEAMLNRLAEARDEEGDWQDLLK